MVERFSFIDVCGQTRQNSVSLFNNELMLQVRTTRSYSISSSLKPGLNPERRIYAGGRHVLSA